MSFTGCWKGKFRLCYWFWFLFVRLFRCLSVVQTGFELSSGKIPGMCHHGKLNMAF